MVLSMDRWVGKVAIITGASSGIGASIAEQLVKTGLQVVGLARRKERVGELAEKLSDEKGKLHAIKADMTNEKEILDAFKWTLENIGPVHILVNNAGVGQTINLVEGDTENWKKVLDTNVLGLCIATREAVNIMRANNINGHIIHINSIAGHKVFAFPTISLYSASKYAVTALTEALMNELNLLGNDIKVTSVSPGYVSTEFADKNDFSKDERLNKFVQQCSALKSEDIADAVLYALSTPPHVQIHELIIKPLK